MDQTSYTIKEMLLLMQASQLRFEAKFDAYIEQHAELHREDATAQNEATARLRSGQDHVRGALALISLIGGGTILAVLQRVF